MTQHLRNQEKIENIGKVYNHSNNTYHLGFKVISIAFFDGQTCLPLDFSVHSEPGKSNKRGLTDAELKKQFKKERDPQ